MTGDRRDDRGGAALERLFRPKTVAVLGAADDEGRPATYMTRKILDFCETTGAQPYLVSRSRSTVFGVPTVASLDVVEKPDVVVLLVADVEGGVAAARDADAGFVIAFAGGFAELGDEGRVAQARLVELLEGSTTRLLGPNTNLNLFEPMDEGDGPSAALVTHSGHQGRTVYQARESGLPLSHWVPTGNEADLDFAEFLRHFAAHDRVRVVAAYVEGFPDGRKLVEALRRAHEAATRVVVVKVGVSEVGRRIATSHTGKLVGGRVTDHVLRQLGAVLVDDLDELVDVSKACLRHPRRSGGVAVYSISGGSNAHVADLLGTRGVPLAELAPSTVEALRALVPEPLRVDNPVDCGGPPAGDERGIQILRALVGDPNVGAVIVPVAAPFPPISDRLASDLIKVSSESDVPIVVAWCAPFSDDELRRNGMADAERLVTVRSYRNAVACVAALLDQPDVETMLPAQRLSLAPVRDELGEALDRRDDDALLRLLGAAGVPVPRQVLLAPDGGLDEVQALRFPVVAKVRSHLVPHRTKVGLLTGGLRDPEAVGATHEAFRARFADLFGADAAYDGTIVAEQVPPGVELLAAVTDDPVFGPVLTVGLGGVHVELIDDVVHLLAPARPDAVLRAVRQLRCWQRLSETDADLPSFAEVASKVSQIGVELLGAGQELEINPVIVGPSGAVAVDALLTPTAAATSAKGTSA